MSKPPSSDVPPGRKFIFFGALAAATLVPGVASAQARSRKRKIVEPVADPAPIDPSGAIIPNENVAAFAEWDTGGLSRLVRRVTMGITPGEVTRATQLGW